MEIVDHLSLVYTCTDATNDRGYERRLGFLVDRRQETEEQSVAGHGVQDSRYREQTSYQASKRKIMNNNNYIIVICIIR